MGSTQTPLEISEFAWFKLKREGLLLMKSTSRLVTQAQEELDWLSQRRLRLQGSGGAIPPDVQDPGGRGMQGKEAAWAAKLNTRMTGRVVSKMAANNFGYIGAPGIIDEHGHPIDVFFHKTAVEAPETMETIKLGSEVDFMLVDSERGLKAVGVRVVSEPG